MNVVAQAPPACFRMQAGSPAHRFFSVGGVLGGPFARRRMTGELPSSIISGIGFIGRGGGQVKALAGFKKGHHTVPDAANAVTNAFLGKICERELADSAEKLFQDVRTRLDYKRKDVALNVTGAVAVLTAKDFTVEILYTLEETAPGRYLVTTTMRDLKDGDLAQREEFAAIFAGKFTEISFALKKGARVEAIIDVIEALDGKGGLTVSYPSDCRDCVIRVDGVDAAVRCSGGTLEMVFPRAGAPHELMAGFAAVREAFAINRVLAGLL